MFYPARARSRSSQPEGPSTVRSASSASSIGASSDPSRVWPGHHMPGRMGGDRRTVLNLAVVRVMAEQNLVLVRGAVPGANGTLVMLRKSVKATKAQQQKVAEKK